MIGCTPRTLLDGFQREEVDRSERDAILQPEIKRAWEANVQVESVPKGWRQTNRSGSQLRLGQTATDNSAIPLACPHRLKPTGRRDSLSGSGSGSCMRRPNSHGRRSVPLSQHYFAAFAVILKMPCALPASKRRSVTQRRAAWSNVRLRVMNS